MDFKERYNLWLEKVKDKLLLKELKSMTEEQISSAFFKTMEFGTAGLRGVVGAGSNRMNIYTVARATNALAIYMKNTNGKKIAISYDSRNMSKEFAELVAGICAKQGITVYLSKELMPTPFLSFMVRFYGCDAGVMITASHNPKDYNGYKVYGSDGCQLLDEPSYKIMQIAEDLDPFEFDAITVKDGVKKGLIHYTDDKILDEYVSVVESISLNKIEHISVLYSALNGTGMQTLPRVIKERGANVILNEVQCVPDKNFTTCPYPNPEKIEVFETSLELAKTCSPDLIIASDPDADRVGVMVKHLGKYVHLTGNEIGIIIEDYLLSTGKHKGGTVIKSVVSSGLAEKIAEKYGAKCHDVLTGFKYIGEFITNLEKQGKQNEFVLGFEESSGYLVGAHVRDKDATVASMFISEIASELKKQNKTIVDRLNEIYDEFGYYQAYVTSYKFAGEVGDKRMKEILSELRLNPPKEFAGFKVLKVTDYMLGIDGLPKANLISFELEQNSRVMVRPSGTEPLIKVYLTLTQTKELNQENKQKLQSVFEKIFK